MTLYIILRHIDRRKCNQSQSGKDSAPCGDFLSMGIGSYAVDMKSRSSRSYYRNLTENIIVIIYISSYKDLHKMFFI